MTYTIKIVEKRVGGATFYVDADLNVVKSKIDCKPLTKPDAQLEARIVRHQAKKLSRPVSCYIVPLEAEG
jgi:hypothetical protein